MIEITDKSECCGCGSCAGSCPVGAISIKADKAGFLYPELNKDLCCDCGMCDKLCPVKNHENKTDLSHEVYIAYAKDKQDRFNGSSGGMFGLIAKNGIKKGATVYGAAFDENLKLRTTPASTEDGLVPLYKSKYLQNDLGMSFSEIKAKLQNNEPVIFVSAPCQVYALKLYLGKEYDNLLTVDFVCHGVPSQELFDKCRAYTEKKNGIRIKDYTFRAKKKKGASPHYYRIKYIKNGREYEKTSIYLDDCFYTGFQKYITLRDSCYDCRFSHSNRVSDITVGDFHEVDKYIEGINRFDGISNLVINSDKGRQVWEEIKDKTVFYPMDFGLLIENKELMCGGTQKPAIRDAFIYDLENKEFDEVADKYLNGRKELLKRAYYKMPDSIRKILKRVYVK